MSPSPSTSRVNESSLSSAFSGATCPFCTTPCCRRPSPAMPEHQHPYLLLAVNRKETQDVLF